MKHYTDGQPYRQLHRVIVQPISNLTRFALRVHPWSINRRFARYHRQEFSFDPRYAAQL